MYNLSVLMKVTKTLSKCIVKCIINGLAMVTSALLNFKGIAIDH